MARHPSPHLTPPSQFLLLLWWTLAGLVIFGAIVCVDQGLVQVMLAADRSHICIVILFMYAIGLGHTLVRSIYLSRQIDHAGALVRSLESGAETVVHVDAAGLRLAGGEVWRRGFTTDYLIDYLGTTPATSVTNEDEGESNLLEVYAARIRAANEFGWFYIDLMLKVGFLGTLVGFILMLSSVADTGALDANTMQKVLTQMSLGMSTALYTTLASLVGGILLSVPYYLLDRGLETLLRLTVHVKEVLVLPRLAPAS